MQDYLITYNKTKTVVITHISPAHARETLRKVIPNVTEINSTIVLPKKDNKNRTPKW